MFASIGVFFEISSNSDSSSGTPARPAIATRWMIAFVDPPIAMSVVMPFSNACRVRMSVGLTSSHTSSTARRPTSDPMRA